MDLISKIQTIEDYVCQHFEELGLDDPIEEETFLDYQDVAGAEEVDLEAFGEQFDVTLPADIRELYRYKNGSQYFTLFPLQLGQRQLNFQFLSLDDIRKVKTYFQNKDALLSDYPDYFSPDDLTQMADERLKPYLFNQKWLPFAVYVDSCYLMLDFDPTDAGKSAQIICYLHDPDQVFYVAESLSEMLEKKVTLH